MVLILTPRVVGVAYDSGQLTRSEPYPRFFATKCEVACYPRDTYNSSSSIPCQVRLLSRFPSSLTCVCRLLSPEIEEGRLYSTIRSRRKTERKGGLDNPRPEPLFSQLTYASQVMQIRFQHIPNKGETLHCNYRYFKGISRQYHSATV